MQKLRSILLLGFMLVLLAGLSTASAQIDSDAEFDWQQFAGSELHFLGIQGPWTDAVTPLIADFEAATGITVTVEILPEAQAWDKIRVQMQAADSSLDVFFNQTNRFSQEFTDNSWLVPLDDYLANTDLTHPEFDYEADFLQYSREAVKFNGVTTAIPTDRTLGPVMAYRMDILEEYGIEPPTTLEELEAAALQIWEESGQTIPGFVNRGRAAAATSHFKYILYEFGGAWEEPLGTITINTPEAVAAFEYYGRILREAGSEASVAFDFAETVNEFLTGNAAITLEGGVNPGNVADESVSSVAGLVGWATIPAGPESEAARATEPCVAPPPFGLSISAFSENQDAAWLFVQWMTSKEAQLDYLTAGRPAARQSAWDSPDFEASVTDVARPYWEAQRQSSQFCYPTPQHSPPSIIDVGRARDIIGQVIVAAILGEDVQAAADMAQQELEAVLARQ